MTVAGEKMLVGAGEALTMAKMEARIGDLERELVKERAVVPEGWMLVPEVPTEAMYTAAARALREHVAVLSAEARNELPRRKRGYDFSPRQKCLIRYRAMLAVAPAPPAKGGE